MPSSKKRPRRPSSQGEEGARLPRLQTFYQPSTLHVPASLGASLMPVMVAAAAGFVAARQVPPFVASLSSAMSVCTAIAPRSELSADAELPWEGRGITVRNASNDTHGHASTASPFAFLSCASSAAPPVVAPHRLKSGAFRQLRLLSRLWQRHRHQPRMPRFRSDFEKPKRMCTSFVVHWLRFNQKTRRSILSRPLHYDGLR